MTENLESLWNNSGNVIEPIKSFLTEEFEVLENEVCNIVDAATENFENFLDPKNFGKFFDRIFLKIFWGVEKNFGVQLRCRISRSFHFLYF